MTDDEPDEPDDGPEDWLRLRYTARGTPRATQADGTRADGSVVLVKNVSRLRLTYQLRLMTAMVIERGSTLTVHVPQGCELSPDLVEFLDEYQLFTTVVEVE